MTQMNTQTQMEQIRAATAARARNELENLGIRPDAPEAAEYMKSALSKVENGVYTAAYNKAMSNLFEMQVPDITMLSEEDAANWGSRYISNNDDADTYATVAAEQILKGMKPITWDEYNKNKRGVANAATQELLGSMFSSFEGSIGSVASGAYSAWDMYGVGGKMWQDEPISPEQVAQHFAGMEKARQIGTDYARFITPWPSESLEELAGPPGEPVLPSERYGIPGGATGEFIVGEAGNIGAALGSLPMSAGSMVAPNAATRAVAMVPFAFSAYGDAKTTRYDIWREQEQLAEQLGIAPPPLPSTAEFETWGAIGAAFEVGSESVGDTLQVMAIRLKPGKWADRFGGSRLRGVLDSLQSSFSRDRGLIGGLKRVGATAGFAGLTEMGEEGFPHVGEQVQDWATELFDPNDEFWEKPVDRRLFSEDTWHSMKVGGYAGAIMGGGASVASPSAFKRMKEAREVAAEARKGTSFVTETLTEGQQIDAARRLAPQSAKVSPSAKKQALENFRRNVMTTRSSAMAMHHVEQLAAGNRGVIVVDPADMATTITPEVRDHMKALGISTKPIGTIDGKKVFAHNADIPQVMDMISKGEFRKLGGNLLQNDGQVMMGAVVLKDKAGRIVEVMPYSDPAEAYAEGPSIAAFAQQNGLTVDVVNHETQMTYADITDSIRRVQDADAVQLGLPQRERQQVPARQVTRGIRALRLDIERVARGSKAKRGSKKDGAFESPYLTAKEVGDAKNSDVTVTVALSRVADDALSDGERNLSTITDANATILDGKVVFSIKQPDGSVRQVEKNVRMDGAYLSQVSPDGMFLIRENGTAMNARTAFAIALHEMRHRTLSRSKAGAQYFAKLLQIDPAYAMRGGAQYMRSLFNDRFSGVSDAQIIAYYRGLHEAVQSVEQGVATTEQQKMVSDAGGFGQARAEIRTFSEESVTTTANRALGQTATLAAEWEGIYRNSQEKSFRRFAAWMSNALVKNGFVGPEAQQALFELRQRLDGVREEEIQIHRKFSDSASESVREDLEQAARRDEARRMRQGGQPAGAAPASTPAAAPSPGVSPSLREPQTRGITAPVGSDEDKRQQIDQALAAVQEAQNAPPEQRDSLLANAIGMLTEVAPLLTQTSAQLAGVRAARPQMQSPTTRRIPEGMRDVAPAEVSVPAPAQVTAQRSMSDLEESARRQRNAQNAMAILQGGQPADPVDLGTVSRIQRAQTFMQDPDEEIRMSVRERPGRREANEDVRRIRNGFMDERGIEPEARIEDTYAEVDPDFAKRLADWFETAEVNYDDPKMLAAYRQFGKETLDQYKYLVDQGYEMIPWAGKGQPYADSADMIEDLRTNKRLYYYKTVNPDEANSFGSNPEAFREAMRKNPLLEDAGIEVTDSEGNPYKQTYNDLFRGVHDILGHGAEGFQFGPQGEENAYRSHAVMFSPIARQAMATETRTQNSWVNFGPNRRNPDDTVWGKEDPRYGPWLEKLKAGEGYADQKPVLTPPEFLGLYEAPQQVRMSLPESKTEPFYHAVVYAGTPRNNRIVGQPMKGFPTFEAARASGEPYKQGEQDAFTRVFRVENGVGREVTGNVETAGEAAYVPESETIRYSSREKKPSKASTPKVTAADEAKKASQSAKRAAAAQKRREADIARKRKQGEATRKGARLDKPSISISAEVTAEPYINPNIITTTAQQDPQFSTQKAYERISGKVADLLSNQTYRLKLGELASAVTDGRVTSVGKPRRILGSFQGRVEQSMRISISGATHEDHVLISNMLGSLLLQEAAITISEDVENAPKSEAATAVIMEADPNISDAALRTLLAEADKQLVGASTMESGKGVWAVYTPYPGNPISLDQFIENAKQFAAQNGLTIEHARVRSTYTTIGETDVLGRTRQGGRKVRDPGGKQGNLDPKWNAWINAAAPIVEALRDEGFDINIPGWIGQVAGTEAPAVEAALIDALAERAAGGRHGLDWRFIRRASVTGQGLADGKPIPAKTTPENAEESFAEVDRLLDRHPNALQDNASFERFLIDLFKDQDIPIVPAELIAGSANNFERMRKEMNLRSNGGRLTPKMVDEAIHGLDMAQRFRALYAAGKVTPTHTVALSMWGFLSRGVSPYIQESLFLDIVNYRSSSGVDLSYFVGKSVAGEWTASKRDAKGKIILPDNSTDGEWRGWVGEMFADAKYEVSDGPELNADGEAVTKNGSIGAAASHNANAFGVSFLGNIGRSVTLNGKTQSGLLHFHEALADPGTSGRKVRRVFASLGGSLGIDNKVVGFSSLVAGKTDISVYDRVRVRDHFDRDGAYPNIYDGYTVGYGVRDGDKLVMKTVVDSDLVSMSDEQRDALIAEPKAQAERMAKELNAGPRPRNKKGKKVLVTVEPVKIAGLANLFNGARGIAIYEAVERSLDTNAIFADIVKERTDLIPHANHGAEHWLNWVGASAQEASHKTLDGLIHMISSNDTVIENVWAKEGRYDTFHYGGEYGYRDVGGKLTAMYRYDLNGTNWEFTPPQYNSFIKALSSFDWGGLNWSKASGTKKPKFLVSVDSTTGGDRTEPWISDPLVGKTGQAKIAELADQFGVRMSLRDMTNEDALDAFAVAFVNAVEKDAMRPAIRSADRGELALEFARQNIAAQSHEQAHELYLRMVKGKYPKPTQPRYTMYFDRNNAMNGIVPNDVWWHGGGRRWVTPNYDISPNQFGLHIGNFDQASHFFDRYLKNQSPFNRTQPVLFPLYARAFKVIEIEDQGSWEPEKILKGMRDAELIDIDEQMLALRDMYDAIGVSVNDDQFADQLDGYSPLNIHIPSDVLKTVDANIFLREWLAERDIDAIRYQNHIEGRARSPFAEEAALSGIQTEAAQEFARDRERKDAEYGEWIALAPKDFEGKVRVIDRMQKRKEVYGDLSSLIVWNTGQIKSASADDVGFRTSMSDIRASMRHQAPAVVNMYPEVFGGESDIRMSQRAGLRGLKDTQTVNYIDKYDPLRRYGEIAERSLGTALPDIANPYQGARVLTGRLGALQAQANAEYTNILRDMHDHGISLEQMDEFLTAQHALNGGNDYIAAHNPRFPDGGTGMTNAEAQAVLMRAQAAGRYGDMNRIAEDWRQMLREGLRQRRDAGLITNELYNTLTTRYTHYVPLRGAPARPEDELFEDYDSGEVFGRGLSTQGRGMPRRYGRASRAEGVTSQVGFLHEDTLRRVARNEIAQRFLRLVTLVNDPMMAEVVRPTRTIDRNGVFVQQHDPNWAQDPQNFGVFVNQPVTINGHNYEPGDLVVIRITNPDLAQAMIAPDRNLTQFELGLRHVNNAWRFATTGMGNPTFAPVNAVRDIGAGALSNIAAHGVRDTAQMMRRYPSAFVRVMRDAWFHPNQPTGSYRRFIEAGGDQVYWRPNDLATKNTDFQQLAERVARRDPNDRSLARTLFGWYPAFFTAAETATRLAQFEQRIATGSSQEQAALAARDITVDFAKGGKRKAGMNTYYMFLNASIQGSVNVGRAFTRSLALAPALVTFGAASALMGRALGGDDDETGGDRWDNIPDYEKAANIILMDPSGSGKYIKIPLPYGFSTMFSAGVRMADAAMGKSTAADAVAGMLTDSLNSFNPFGGSGIKQGLGSVLSAFVPTMMRPASELALNENWMGRPIYPKSFGKQEKADAYSYFTGTPEVYTTVAQVLNEGTGGDMFEGGVIDMSPNTMQYLVGYYLSGAGRNVDRLVKMATSNEPIEAADVPFLRSFVGDAANDTRSLSERYNAISAKAMPDVRRAEAVRDPAVPRDVREGIIERGIDRTNLQIGKVVTEADKALRRINKAMKTATPEQRERLLEVRQRAMKAVIRENNRLTPE